MSYDSQGGVTKQGLSGCAIVAIVVACLGVGMFCLLGIGVALLLPAVQAAREAARRNACSNDLKQIGLALLNYEKVYGSFPPAYVADSDGKPMHSWRVLILPYLEEQSLYAQYDFKEPWNGPNNSKLAAHMPSVYRCPSYPGDAPETNYLAVVGPETMWPGSEKVSVRKIKDGMSNTLMVVESSGSGINWMEPKDLTFDQALQGVNAAAKPGISSSHSAGANVVFADGSVHFLPNSVPPDLLRSLLTIAGGEVINHQQLDR